MLSFRQLSDIRFTFLCLTFFSLFFFFCHNAFSQSAWYWNKPLPTGNILNSIHFTSPNTGFAAGSLGTIIKTTNAGKNWFPLSSGTSKDLFEIFSISDNIVFAVGAYGIILKSENGGDSWIEKQNLYPHQLHDIFFINKNTGYAAGLGGTVLKTTDAGEVWLRQLRNNNSSFFCISFFNAYVGIAAGYQSIFLTTNGGISWTDHSSIVYPATGINGVCHISNTTIYAAGNSRRGAFYKTTDGGVNWTTESLELDNLDKGTVDLVKSMSFVNAHTGFIVTGSGNILKTFDAGNTWSKDSSFKHSGKISVMQDIHANSKCIMIAGAGGTVFKSTDTGSGWIALTGNESGLNASFIVNSAAYCAGEKGEALKSTDNGITWQSCGDFTNKKINSLYFLNELKGYAAGDSGIVFKTTDGGGNWMDQTGYANLNYKNIYFNNETGLALGGNPDDERAFIYRTSNGGVNWYEVYDSMSLGVLNSVSFTSEFVGFAVSDNGNVLKTIDAGYNWEAVNIAGGNLNSVSFMNSATGFICGDDGVIFKTTNEGAVWEYIFCGTFKKLNCIKLAENGLIYAAGIEGTIVKSTDLGNSWITEKKITGNDLHSIDIIGNRLTAFGDFGTVIYSEKKNNVQLANQTSNNDFILKQNFPNPFNPKTTLQYQLAVASDVKLKIYDALGREAAVLVDREESPGSHEIYFDATDLPSGIYYYSLEAEGNLVDTKRMVVLK